MPFQIVDEHSDGRRPVLRISEVVYLWRLQRDGHTWAWPFGDPTDGAEDFKRLM